MSARGGEKLDAKLLLQFHILPYQSSSCSSETTTVRMRSYPELTEVDSEMESKDEMAVGGLKLWPSKRATAAWTANKLSPEAFGLCASPNGTAEHWREFRRLTRHAANCRCQALWTLLSISQASSWCNQIFSCANGLINHRNLTRQSLSESRNFFLSVLARWARKTVSSRSDVEAVA